MRHLEAAIEAVRCETFSQRSAAAFFEVSRSTLQHRLNGRRTGEKKQGRQTKFTAAEEHELAELVMRCAELGVPITKVLFMKVVRDWAKKKRRFLCWPLVTDGL